MYDIFGGKQLQTTQLDHKSNLCNFLVDHTKEFNLTCCQVPTKEQQQQQNVVNGQRRIERESTDQARLIIIEEEIRSPLS